MAVADDDFDLIYPAETRCHSHSFWTPVEAVIQTAAFFKGHCTRVLDVGSGGGKFCLIAAHLCPETSFFGIEHRPTLVKMSQALALQAELANLTFQEGDAFALNWQEFDGLYIYNPFQEQFYSKSTLNYVDNAVVPLSEQNHFASTWETTVRLRRLARGTRVGIYNGLGTQATLSKHFQVHSTTSIKGCPLILAEKIN